jgi:hypothetical protein
MKPAIPAARTTTVILVIGEGESSTLGPLKERTAVDEERKVGSGILSIAERQDRVQVSIVLRRIP